ncbi:3-deoxy-D-manno-octulosonic acid transferase [Granulicella sp. dw_53]|uniref:3-deoxy-D-manno-octulosonic acid transferase n=1 Tax=Granulicella sp. dw_53 TaxID=2719792 RepID=UPI001BD31E6E|nr:3-deoxy-D-manno-octulosonic acid transferase [Granulicella sp. dw_53]
MAVYSLLLFLTLVVGAPYWLVRMMTSGRYRAGLAERLGRTPERVTVAGSQAAEQGRGLVWVHAVSVGEVLAATALVKALQQAGLAVAVSTTTQAGQALARKRFPECAVFYMPLDFAVLVRRYLRALRPKLVVTMESELWPNMIRECKRAGIPLAVVNARVSDRSFPRYMRLRRVWGPRLREVTVFLAQSEETAARLLRMGVAAERVRVTGNLKYDVRAPQENRMADAIRKMAAGRPVLVAGSTLGRTKDDALSEDEIVLQAWQGAPRQELDVMLVLAPRHTDRFAEVESVLGKFCYRKASNLTGNIPSNRIADTESIPPASLVEIVLLDTIGDLAAVYGVADVAFVGGSLVAKGGHNPLEPAQFGVPVVMGESYANFREIVGAMQEAEAIRIVERSGLADVLMELLCDREGAAAMGGRGRVVFEAQAGATERTVDVLLDLVGAKR